MSSKYRRRHDGKTVPREKEKIGGPFMFMLYDTLDSAAWRAMSYGARCLYVALKRQYKTDRHNNGKIYLSFRQAQHELGGCSFESLWRWFDELQHFGFIVQVKAGCLGFDGTGKAPHWRLTELGTRLYNQYEEPTRDFLKWDGTPFRWDPPKKQKPKLELVVGKKENIQNPAPKIEAGCSQNRSSSASKIEARTPPECFD